MSGNGMKDDEAVTVIVGTLMLILVTVTAAAGLAVMVSQMQKDEMNRQSHQAAVKNELLKVTGIHPVYNETTGALAELNVTILNLNTADSKVNLIGLGDRLYPSNFTARDGAYNNTYAGYLIPAGRQGEISLNMTRNFPSDPNITRADTIRVFVITSYYNTFEQTFKPPAADFTLTIESEDLGVAERDVIVLDGSPSSDDGAIVDWTWSIFEPNTSLSQLSGKKARFVPMSTGPFEVRLTVTDETGMQGISPNKTVPLSGRFFPPTYLAAVPSGNFLVATVTNLNGHPVGNATVTFIKFYDVHGNLSLSQYAALTNDIGEVNVSVLSGEGTIRVECGKISPVFVPVKYSP